MTINPTLKTYLVAPLDWGLGHATRCIPLIRHLLNRGNKVYVCGEGAISTLLKKEFPEVEFLPLKGYRISYTKKSAWFMWKIMLQLPKIYFAIRREHKWLAEAVSKLKIDVVISDNRLGLYHSNCRTVYMTHQLALKTGNSYLDSIAQQIHYSYINRFNECWVPDLEKEQESVAGRLSHPESLPKTPVRYIGLLSRMTTINLEKKYDLVVLISGPEPQRTLFENHIIAVLKDYSGKAMVVRGLPGESKPISGLSSNIEQANHLDTEEMSTIMQSASLVLCRSGYSTVMDLLKTGTPAVLLPTPGQTEQEYLATRLQDLGYFLTRQQERLSAEDFKFALKVKKVNSINFNLFEKALESVGIDSSETSSILPNR